MMSLEKEVDMRSIQEVYIHVSSDNGTCVVNVRFPYWVPLSFGFAKHNPVID